MRNHKAGYPLAFLQVLKYNPARTCILHSHCRVSDNFRSLSSFLRPIMIHDRHAGPASSGSITAHSGSRGRAHGQDRPSRPPPCLDRSTAISYIMGPINSLPYSIRLVAMSTLLRPALRAFPKPAAALAGRRMAHHAAEYKVHIYTQSVSESFCT